MATKKKKKRTPATSAFVLPNLASLIYMCTNFLNLNER